MLTDDCLWSSISALSCAIVLTASAFPQVMSLIEIPLPKVILDCEVGLTCSLFSIASAGCGFFALVVKHFSTTCGPVFLTLSGGVLVTTVLYGIARCKGEGGGMMGD